MKKQYVDIEKHWNKIKPYAVSEMAIQIWKQDLKKFYTFMRVYGNTYPNTTFDIEWFNRYRNFESFFKNNKPSGYDTTDWRYELEEGPGRKPAFWDFVVHGKCHWMVNLNVFLAEQVFPKEPWRIITGPEHSCVWNGRDLLFDMNFSALVPDVRYHPYYNELGEDVIILPIGEKLKFLASDIDVETLDMYDEGQISINQLREWFF